VPALKRLLGIVLVLLVSAALPVAAGAKSSAQQADAALKRALRNLVSMPGGPPGVIVLVQRGDQLRVHAAGHADVAKEVRPKATDHMRVASVAKAFSGGVALSLVDKGTLSLNDTIGKWRPDLPAAWHAVTLRQLLNHTSGVPDFTASRAFQDAVRASLAAAPPPRALLSYVEDDPLNFTPGSEYRYSNSDNIVVGLMVEAATGRSYEDALQEQVAGPLQLAQTTLPRGPELPKPFIHGYDLEEGGQPEDNSEIFASGWAWASGGIVLTPADLNRFIRGYVGGELFGLEVQSRQRRFVAGGGSEPTGPGRNSAGLALFRYQTRCGTVYGHTGNTFGFTQFAAASSDGSRSATVSINIQRTQDSKGQAGAVFRALRRAELLAVCAALAS
jgi:D-alanyl-D-alanine carboxypeptidase